MVVVVAVVLHGSGHRSAAAADPGPQITARLAVTLNDYGGEDVVAAMFGPSGTLETVDEAGSAYTFDIGSGRVTNSYDLGNTDMNNARMTGDGESVIVPTGGCAASGPGSCDYEGFFFQVQEWDAKIVAGKGGAFGVGYDTLAVADPNGGGVQVWNMESLMRIADLPVPDQRPVTGVAVSPDDSVAAVGSAGLGGPHKVYVWNLNSRALSASLTVPLGFGAVAAGPRGDAVPMALDQGGGTLALSDGRRTAVYSVPSGRLLTMVTGGLTALSPDGTLFATTDPAGGGRVELHDTQTGQVVANLVIPTAGITPSTVVFSPNSRSVAVGGDNAHTYVWDLSGS